MSVLAKKIDHGLLFDGSQTMYPSRMFGHMTGKSGFESHSSTYFGYVLAGQVSIRTATHRQSLSLETGMYFALTGPLEITGDGQTVVIERLGYRALNSFGGPVEKEGRLVYIDNCRTSILASPPRLGDPVFNLLTFPERTRQTMHIHPSIRLGVVAWGEGTCVMPNQKFSLKPGSVFLIEEGSQHCFHTEDSTMAVIAYHPDGDWGPTDENHPMLNRTYRRT